jgi:hypothetical protein
MTAEIIKEFFAWAPITVFASLIFIVWFATRTEGRPRAVAHGKTYSCARCGRRGTNAHMVPATHEGAVVWYCGRCASREAATRP